MSERSKPNIILWLYCVSYSHFRDNVFPCKPSIFFLLSTAMTKRPKKHNALVWDILKNQCVWECMVWLWTFTNSLMGLKEYKNGALRLRLLKGCTAWYEYWKCSMKWLNVRCMYKTIREDREWNQRLWCMSGFTNLFVKYINRFCEKKRTIVYHEHGDSRPNTLRQLDLSNIKYHNRIRCDL